MKYKQGKYATQQRNTKWLVTTNIIIQIRTYLQYKQINQNYLNDCPILILHS